MQLLSRFFKKAKKEWTVKVVKEWEFLADDDITTAPAVSKDSSFIAFGTKSGKIYALDSMGKKRWVYEAKKSLSKEQLFFLDQEKFKQISANPAIADIDDDRKDEVIVGSESGSLLVLNPNGKLLWSYPAGDAIRASALIADINNDKKMEIIFGCNDSFIYC